MRSISRLELKDSPDLVPPDFFGWITRGIFFFEAAVQKKHQVSIFTLGFILELGVKIAPGVFNYTWFHFGA